MGYEFEVYSWEKSNTRIDRKWDSVYTYVMYYQGGSFFRAICKMWELKLQGHLCVKLEWR